MKMLTADKVTNILVLAIGVSFHYAAIAASDCEIFAKYGIYDTRASSSDTSKADSFRSWFCQSNFAKKSDADSAGGDIGYDAYKLGYNQSTQS